MPRDLALGRVYLPAEDRRRFGVTVLDAPNEPLTALLALRGRPRARPARGRASGSGVASAAGSGGRSGCSPAAASLRSRRSRTRGWDVFTGRAADEPLARGCAGSARRQRAVGLGGRCRDAGGVTVDEAYAEVERLTRAACAELRLRDHGAAEAEAAGDRRDLRLRARGRRHRRRRGASPTEKREPARGAARAASTASRRTRRCSSRSPTPAPLPDPGRGAARPRRRRPAGPRADSATRRSTSCAATAAASPARSASPASPSTAPTEPQRAETLGVALQLINIIRDVAEDWELGRVYLPQDELAPFGVTEEDIAAGQVTPEWRALMAYQAPAPAATSPRAASCSTPRPAQRRLRRRRSRALRGDARPDRGARLRRVRRAAAAVAADEAPDRRAGCPVRVAVVGGGLAGLSRRARARRRGPRGRRCYEARPTLGGAVQTLPEREGDPAPPPDNGQHIALGCFTEYLRLPRPDRQGRRVRREPLDLPVIDEDAARASTIRPGAARCSATATFRSRERLRVVRVARRAARLTAGRAADETFGALLRRLGCADAAIDRFWDVFIRPALNLRTDEVGAEYGRVHRADRAARQRRGERPDPADASRSGEMHGDAAGRALDAAGRRRVRLESRVESLDDARRRRGRRRRPARRERAAARRAEPPALEDSPIVSVHLLFDRPLLAHPSPRCSTALRTGSSTAARSPGTSPSGGQYLTVVSSGVPELLEMRGRGLVDLIAGAAARAARPGGARSGRASAASRARRSRRGPGHVHCLADARPAARTSSAPARGPPPAGRRRWRARCAAAAPRRAIARRWRHDASSRS